MRHPMFFRNIESIAIKVILVSVFLIVSLALIGHGQEEGVQEGGLSVSYFVSPEYPPLARQAMMSGDVVLSVIVNPSGTPKEIDVKAPYALLGWGAKETVSQWHFTPWGPPGTRKAVVKIHYGFSGTRRDCNPKTTVTADLDGFDIIVTVDPRLPFEGDSFPSEGEAEKKQE